MRVPGLHDLGWNGTVASERADAWVSCGIALIAGQDSRRPVPAHHHNGHQSLRHCPVLPGVWAATAYGPRVPVVVTCSASQTPAHAEAFEALLQGGSQEADGDVGRTATASFLSAHAQEATPLSNRLPALHCVSSLRQQLWSARQLAGNDRFPLECSTSKERERI
jgi:hypothetical protein